MKIEGIWVVPYVERDEVGDPILDGNGDPVLSGTPWFWANCQIWPRQSAENAEAGPRVIDGQNVWIRGIPRDTDNTIRVIDPRDTVLLRQTEYQVDGVPGYFIGKGWKLVLRRV